MLMAKKEIAQKQNVATKELKTSLLGLNNLARNVLKLANGNTNSDRDTERNQLKNEIDEVVKNNLKEISSVEGTDMNTLLTRFVTREAKNTRQDVPTSRFDIQDIFENESSGILAHFEERYRNHNLQLEDLHIIRKQIKELDLAVSVTRDAILTADDVSATVSRTISFSKGTVSDADMTEYLRIIEELEREFKLPKKLKNHIVPNSLTFGNYYVYTIPYSEIFSKAMYDKIKQSKQGKNFNVRESAKFNEKDLTSVLENYDLASEENKEKAKEYVDTANSLLKSITVENLDIPIPLLEGTGIGNMARTMDEEAFTKMANKATKSGMSSIKDNVAEFDENNKEFDFTEFKGCFMQLIDPRRMIPVKVLDQTLGYYYLHEEKHKRMRSPFTSNFNVDMTTNASKVESDFLLSLSEKIIQDFDKKFLEENNEFKETIINSIIYHNIYGKNIRFQFIPAKYITEFPVNEDENGNGQSILVDALFYAKLYLALLIFKMIAIIARSNDQRMFYVRTSGMDKDVTNSVQDIVRQMRQREISFNDLLNYKSIVSKVGAGRDIYMPVGPEDMRGIDFETLAGQDIQMNSDLMDMLKTSAINATEVPSVMMQYVNEADYARTLDMGNARFANTTAGYQIDYNASIAELYRKLLLFSGKNIPPEVIDSLVYKLNPPASLNLTNNNNLINEVQQEIDFILKAIVGTNADPGELDNHMMDILTKRIAKLRVGSIKWDAIEDMVEDVMIEAKERMMQRKEAAASSEE